MPSSHFSSRCRAVSTYFAVLILIAASLGLSLVLYDGYSSALRLEAPPVCEFRFRAVDSGLGYEQVLVEFKFDRNVTLEGLLLNGTAGGFLSLSPDGSYIPANGGIEFFSFVLPSDGTYGYLTRLRC